MAILKGYHVTVFLLRRCSAVFLFFSVFLYGFRWRVSRGLQQKAAQVPDPTAYIKIAVQRANGECVAPAAKAEIHQDDADEEMDDCRRGGT